MTFILITLLTFALFIDNTESKIHQYLYQSLGEIYNKTFI